VPAVAIALHFIVLNGVPSLKMFLAAAEGIALLHVRFPGPRALEYLVVAVAGRLSAVAVTGRR